MKKILVFLFVFIMIMAQQTFGATYNISPNASANPTVDACTPPPFSSTVSPYANQGNCPAQPQMQNNAYGNQQYPQYSVQQAQPQIQQGLYYNQNRQFTGQAYTLADLPPGTIVMDPKSVWNFRKGDNYSGEIEFSHPVFWRKLEDNHYAQGSTLLLSEVTVAGYPFCHQKKGLRAWDESDVRRFLRTTFYNHLSDGFKNSIVNVNIPFADMQGSPKTINDNLFLLSIVEWGLSDRKNNGSVIKYNDLPNIYVAKEFSYDNREHFSQNPYDLTYYSGHNNWTRTINRPAAKSAGYDREVFTVSGEGVLDTTSEYYDSYVLGKVRPAVNIKSTARVSGPYQFIHHEFGSPVSQNSFIYYTLDF